MKRITILFDIDDDEVSRIEISQGYKNFATLLADALIGDSTDGMNARDMAVMIDGETRYVKDGYTR